MRSQGKLQIRGGSGEGPHPRTPGLGLFAEGGGGASTGLACGSATSANALRDTAGGRRLRGFKGVHGVAARGSRAGSPEPRVSGGPRDLFARPLPARTKSPTWRLRLKEVQLPLHAAPGGTGVDWKVPAPPARASARSPNYAEGKQLPPKSRFPLPPKAPCRFVKRAPKCEKSVC